MTTHIKLLGSGGMLNRDLLNAHSGISSATTTTAGGLCQCLRVFVENRKFGICPSNVSLRVVHVLRLLLHKPGVVFHQ